MKVKDSDLDIKKSISSFTVITVCVCLSILGVFLIPKLSVKLNPSRRLPQVNISFSMYGESARVVETEVTSKLEAMLNRVRDVREISSFSANGYGSITVGLSKYADPDIARFEISTIIRQAWASLPSGVSYPHISMSGTSDEVNTPFLSYTVNAPLSPVVIQEYVENHIKPKLAIIKGVDKIDVSGASRMVYKLTYDYNKLQQYRISTNDIRNAINTSLENESLGMGKILDEETSQKQWIRIALESKEANDFFDPASIQVKVYDGTIIYLNQIVQCSFEEEEASSYYRINGLNSIYLSITANQQANQLKLSKYLRQILDDMQDRLPEGYQLHMSYDAGEYIQAELNKIYFRSGLTILILLCFVFLVYRNMKYSLLILTSLVINIAVSIILYYLLRIEMQLFSLAGLTVSLTLIIDNVIIMSDQIIQRNNKKVFLAILTATATTVGALTVIFFMKEEVRLNLQDFSWVIIINLSVSIIIAFLLVPALIDKLGIKKQNYTKKRDRTNKNKITKNRLVRLFKNKTGLIYFNRTYERVIVFMYRKRVWFVIVLILSFGLPVFLLPEKIEKEAERGFIINYSQEDEGFFAKIYNLTLGSTFYKEKIKPVSDVALGGSMRLFAQKVKNGSYSSGERSETSLHVAASLPNGSTKEQMDVLIRHMESYISQYSQVRQFETNIYNGRQASIRIFFTKENQRGSFPHMLKSKLISKSLELGGGSWSVYGFFDGFNNDVKEQAGSSRIKLLGYNYDELNRIANNMRDSLLEYRRIKEVTIDSKFSWFKNDYMEYVFDLNKDRLSQLDIQPIALFNSLTPMFYRNIDAGTFVSTKGVEPIRLYSRQAQDLDIWDLEHYPVKLNNEEKEYKLTEVANIQKSNVSQGISKENQQYLLCLQYEYIGSYQQAWSVLERTVKAFNKIIPLGYKVDSEAQRYWWGKGDGDTHYWLLFLIVIIVFFTTSVLFNSLLQPLVVIFIIPVSYIGVFLTFYLFDLNFDQGGFASFILLSGLSVNANIYILSEYNNIRKRYANITPIRAYMKAWNAKIRPVFLTISSTALGFIPFMIGKYKESFWFPLAAGTTGGLIFSLIALFVFLPLFMGVGKKEKSIDLGEKYYKSK